MRAFVRVCVPLFLLHLLLLLLQGLRSSVSLSLKKKLQQQKQQQLQQQQLQQQQQQQQQQRNAVPEKSVDELLDFIGEDPKKKKRLVCARS